MKRFCALLVLVVAVFFLLGCKAKSKEEMFQEGMSLKEAGNLSGAIVLFRNALEKDPNFTDARYEMGKIFLETEKYQRAENEFTKVVLQEPGRKDAVLDLIRTLLAAEKFEDAETRLTDYQTKYPEDAEGSVLLGQLYGRTARLDESRRAYEQALRLDPAHKEAPLGLATVHMAQNRFADARTVLEQGLERGVDPVRVNYILARIAMAENDLPQFKAIWEKVLTIDEKDLSANYQLGLIALEEGKPEETLNYAKKLQRHHADRPEGYQLEGFALFTQDQFEKAIPRLQESLRRGEHFQTHYYLGMSFFQRDNLELAINHFNKVLDLEPSMVQARIMLATTLLKQGRSGAAVIEAQRAVQAAPYNAFARNLLGSAYVMEEKFNEAMAEFDAAALLDPEMSSVHLKKGILGLQQGNVDEAILSLREAVAGNPDDLNSRLLLAEIYLRQGRLDASYEVLAQGQNGSARDALLLNRMAFLKSRQGEREAARDLLFKAKELSPEYASSYINLASYYQSSGEPQNALTELDQLLGRDPDHLQALLYRSALLEGQKKNEAAEADLKKAVASQDARAFQAYTGFLQRQGAPAKALAQLQKGLEYHPEEQALLEQAGRLSIATKKPSDAVTYFERLHALNPEQGAPLLAGALVAADQKDRAVKLAEDLLAADPTSPRGYLLMASIQQHTGEADAALATLNEGFGKAGMVPGLVLMKGGLLERRSEDAKALKVYDDALRSSPDQPLLLFAKASLLHRLERHPEAVELYQQGLKVNPAFAPALNNLAYIYLKAGDKKEEGLQLALRAYQAAPLDPAVLDTLGFALHKNGQLEPARKVLEAAANRLSGHPTVHYHLASVYFDLGETALAAEHVNNALKNQSFPEFSQAQELLKRIEQAQ